MKLQSSKVRYWRYSVFPHLNIELDHLPSPSPVRLPPHISSPLPYSLLSSFRGFSCFNCGDSMFITRRLSTSICVLDSGTKTAIFFFLNFIIVLGTNVSSKTVFVKHYLSGTETTRYFTKWTLRQTPRKAKSSDRHSTSGRQLLN